MGGFMTIVIDGTTGITTPDIISTTSTLGALTQALDLGSTGQIVFPATQSASSDANTLDDYEEGTYTVTDQSGAGLTFTSNTGKYVKIGKVVNFYFDITFPSTASTANIKISLPFTSSATIPCSAAVGYSNSGSIPSAYISTSSTGVAIYSTTGVAVTNITFSGKELAISGSYTVD